MINKWIETYLELQSSEGKHQFSQINLQLSENTGQFTPRKHETLGDFISRYMVYRGLLLTNRFDKGNPLILKQRNPQTENKLHGYYKLESQKNKKIKKLKNCLLYEIEPWRNKFKQEKQQRKATKLKQYEEEKQMEAQHRRGNEARVLVGGF